MPPTKKSSPAKAPAKKPMHVKKHVVPAPPKSQYELERDERIKRNEKFMLALGINPYGSGYLKEKKRRSQSSRRNVGPSSAPHEQVSGPP